MEFSEEKIRAYLLEELAEEERLHLDEQLFSAPDLFDYFAIVEDDLLDDYLSGQLTAARKERFETHYLVSAQRRVRLEAARLMQQSLKATPGKNEAASRSGWRLQLAEWWQPLRLWPAIVAALLLLVAGLIFWTRISSRPNQTVRQTNDPLATPTPAPTVTPTPTVTPVPAGTPRPSVTPPNLVPSPGATPSFSVSPPVLATLVLQPGNLRGPGRPAQTLKLAPATKEIQLMLIFPPTDLTNLRAVIATPEGTEVVQQNLRRQSGQRRVTISLPASRLAAGDYILRLYGVNPEPPEELISDYVFRVLRRP